MSFVVTNKYSKLCTKNEFNFKNFKLRLANIKNTLPRHSKPPGDLVINLGYFHSSIKSIKIVDDFNCTYQNCLLPNTKNECHQ